MKREECGAKIDQSRLFRTAGVFYLGQGPTCTLPVGHGGLHRDYDCKWGADWTAPADRVKA